MFRIRGALSVPGAAAELSRGPPRILSLRAKGTILKGRVIYVDPGGLAGRILFSSGIDATGCMRLDDRLVARNSGGLLALWAAAFSCMYPACLDPSETLRRLLRPGLVCASMGHATTG